MAISTESQVVQAAGNGVTTAFSFPYRFDADGDLVVIITSSAGVETTQTITTHYTVSGAGESAGGTVTMVTAPASGETLTIYRDPDLTQTVDFVENDSFPAESTETALDRATMLIQRIHEILDVTTRLTPGYTGTFTSTLPSDIATANAVLKVNSSGNGWAVGPTTTEIENAETHATNASTSASAAASSATAASSSATSAAASAASAAAQLASAFFTDAVFYDNTDSPITLDSTANGKLLVFDSSGGAITVNLPEISGITTPFNIAALCATAGNDITFNRGGASDTIQGATTKVLSVANTGFQLIADTDPSPDTWSVLEFGSVGDGTVTGVKLSSTVFNDLTTVTLADTDQIPIADASDSNGKKKVLASDITRGGLSAYDNGDSPVTGSVEDRVVVFDASGGAITYTLPDNASVAGQRLKFVIGTGGNLVTLSRAGSDTIFGSLTSIVMSGLGDVVELISDGAGDWVAGTSESRYRTVTVTLTGNGTSDPVTADERGEWVSTTSRSNLGAYSITIKTGIFSADPCCVAIPISANDGDRYNVGVWLSTGSSATAVGFISGWADDVGGTTDSRNVRSDSIAFEVTVRGPR